MDKIEYIPNGVCSRKMTIEIENNIIKSVKIVGGCPGNTLGVSELCKDKTVDEVINKLKGIKCGLKPTSCPDQLTIALTQYKNKKETI